MDDRNASIRLSERPPGGGLSPPVRPQQTAAELAQLKLRELKHRARELGVSEDKIDALDDADDVKVAAVRLVLQAMSADARPTEESPQSLNERRRRLTRMTSEPHPTSEPYQPIDSSHPLRSCLGRVYVQKEIRWAKQIRRSSSSSRKKAIAQDSSTMLKLHTSTRAQRWPWED